MHKLTESEESELMLLFTHNTCQATVAKSESYNTLHSLGYVESTDNRKFSITAEGIAAAKKLLNDSETFTYNMFGGL